MTKVSTLLWLKYQHYYDWGINTIMTEVSALLLQMYKHYYTGIAVFYLEWIILLRLVISRTLPKDALKTFAGNKMKWAHNQW